MSQNAKELFDLMREKSKQQLRASIDLIDATTDFAELAHAYAMIHADLQGYNHAIAAAQVSDRLYGEDMPRRKASAWILEIERLHEKLDDEIKEMQDKLDTLTKRLERT